MAIANVATSGAKQTNTSGSPGWTRSPTANHLLTCRETSFNGQIAATGVTTTGGAGTFHQDVTVEAGTNGECAGLYSLLAPAGVTSMQISGTQYIVAVFDEWSGNATSSVQDQTATDSNTGNPTSGDSGTIASAGANAGLAIAAINVDTGQSGAPTSTGSGWTQDASGTDLASGFAYKLASMGGTAVEETWTFGATAYAACVATYNAVATAASTWPAWRRPRRITIPVRGLA